MKPVTAMVHADYIRRETIVSLVVNGALSLLFFIIMFGRLEVVPVWGMGNWVFDFLPQSFLIALMSTLVPGLLAAKKIKAGAIIADGAPSTLPKNLLVRAVMLALMSALVGVAAVAALVTFVGIDELSNIAAAAIKVGYGIALACIVTPLGLRAALAGQEGYNADVK